MKKAFLLISIMIICSSHDMFLKMGTYYLTPHTTSTIELYNGTFERSDNIIDRDRMIDVSLVANGARTLVDSSQWTEANLITTLNFKTGDEGTWVAGVSTRARSIEMDAKDFNEYLVHDGVLDMIKWRKENNVLDQNANEKYSKHVKTIFQVGEKKSEDWKVNLGYPLEFIALKNPYETEAEDKLSLQLLWRGKPLANQIVYAGSRQSGHHHAHDHNHDEGEDHHHHDATKLRTDANGHVTMDLNHEGVWFLRTIHMERLQDSVLTHESNWATITFEIGDAYSSGEHGHSHGAPKYVYLIACLAILTLLVVRLRRKPTSNQ